MRMNEWKIQREGRNLGKGGPRSLISPELAAASTQPKPFFLGPQINSTFNQLFKLIESTPIPDSTLL